MQFEHEKIRFAARLIQHVVARDQRAARVVEKRDLPSEESTIDAKVYGLSPRRFGRYSSPYTSSTFLRMTSVDRGFYGGKRLTVCISGVSRISSLENRTGGVRAYGLLFRNSSVEYDDGLQFPSFPLWRIWAPRGLCRFL
jgi:hypothetical protein